MIPLNVDGLRPRELDWMTNDLTFISFRPSWADGLRDGISAWTGTPCPFVVPLRSTARPES